MKLNPIPNSFGYDKLEFVTREPIKEEFMARHEDVPPSGDWLDKTYRYMAEVDFLQVFWEPRKWIWSTLPYKAHYNPSRAGRSGWETWDDLTQTAFTTLSNARVRRVDSKLDFNNTLAEVLSCLYLKGAKVVNTEYVTTIYIGEFGGGGVQLVIYDKGLKELGLPDRWIRVEVRQWFETDAWAQRQRPLMIEFMRGDLMSTNPFKDVAWINPERLDPQVRTVAAEKGLNYALLPVSGISEAIRKKTRLQLCRYGNIDYLYGLFLTGAEPWHQSFNVGLEFYRYRAAAAEYRSNPGLYAGMTLEQVLFWTVETTPPRGVAWGDFTRWDKAA